MRKAAPSPAGDLGARIRDVRVASSGENGRARFARALRVEPSTYARYERGRIPPMPLLLKVAEAAGADVRWLLTGAGPASRPTGNVAPGHASILARLAADLPQRAESVAALAALLDLLETPPVAQTTSGGPSTGRVPVLGRTAAGVPQFWTTPDPSLDVLTGAIERLAARGRATSAVLDAPDDTAGAGPNTQVRLVQLSRPVRAGGLDVAEYLDGPALPERRPGAFALRIDGDSMEPVLSHGDLVILAPGVPARPGRPAVVQLRDQIGVTCKLFRRDGRRVRLIPANERYPSTSHPARDVVWALAVLYRVRLSPVAR
jgi:SOS-response transcriptional repressor LexA